MKNRIQELRRDKRMTQEELAGLCSVTRQTIISLESGRYNPSIFLAHKIAQIFELSIEEVFIFEEDTHELR
ncbi:MAG: helix-turn-helix transcriptional regulator [Peptococcaceae bacterium]|nr:helix-turn-helix transcriptional regulator [Peptococcaceae bacterium]